MRHFLIFAGTTEGRQLAEQLSQLGARVSVSVATVYGKHLVPESEQIEVHAKRLTADEMADWVTAEHFDEVIDATHPYAVEVTANIKAACKKTETHYLRLIRESIHADDCVYTATTEEAAAFLNTTTGNVLLTTGSNCPNSWRSRVIKSACIRASCPRWMPLDTVWSWALRPVIFSPCKGRFRKR